MQSDKSAIASQWERLEAAAPENPFLTHSYATVRQRLGEELVMLEAGPQLCPAYVKRGRISANLEVPSLPFAPSDGFVSYLVHFCRRRHIYEADLYTFASRKLNIPKLPREIERRNRTEFLFDLTVPAEKWKIGETHRRHIRRAQKNAISVRRARSEGLRDHLSVCGDSMLRRRERGENVPSVEHDPQLAALVQGGVGELFQAVRQETVLSSMLVIRSRTGAYYHSAGTSPEGMELGASHFLVHFIAGLLQDEGMESFNLGGAEVESPGLRAFKSRFGTRPVETETVRAVLCGTSHRTFVDVCHWLKAMCGG